MSNTINQLRPTQNPQTRFVGQPGTPAGLTGPQIPNALQMPPAGAPAVGPAAMPPGNPLMAQPQPQPGPIAPGLQQPPPAAPPQIQEVPRDLSGVEHEVSTRIPASKKLTYNPHETAALEISHDAMKPEALGKNEVSAKDFEGARNNVEKAYRNSVSSLRVQYPHINTTGMGDEQAAEAVIGHLHDNIVSLWDRVKNEPWRDAAVNWYRGANKIAKDLSGKFDISHRQAAAVIAAMSPQKDWDQNVNLAERVLNIRDKHQDTAVSPEMKAAMQAFVDQRSDKTKASLQKRVDQVKLGTKLSELSDPVHQALFIRSHDEAHNPDRSFEIISPTGERTAAMTKGTKKEPGGKQRAVAWGSIGEIANAMQALQGDHLPTISRSLGGNHKVRSFYNNIIAPDSDRGDVTADTHAINVGLMRPMGSKHLYVGQGLGSAGFGSNATGTAGLYGLHADAYRRAAQTISEREGRRYLPREVQSVTWETMRNIFNNKAHKKVDKVTGEPLHHVGTTARDAWNAVRYELMHPERARDLIVQAAGGVKPPAWHGGVLPEEA